MTQLITSTYGNTVPGQQMASLADTLASLTAMPVGNVSQDDLQKSYASALSQSLGAQNVAPDQVRQATQTLTTQSGIPKLQGQYGDIAKIFDMYLHDGNLAGKYTDPNANINPYTDPTLAGATAPQVNQPDASIMGTPQTAGYVSGQATSAPNPYLGSTDALAASGSNAPQAPSLTTAEMGQPVNAASNFMSLLNSLIGTEQGIVGSKATDFGTLTQGKESILNTLATALGGALSSKVAQNAPGNAINTPGTSQHAAATYQTAKQDFVNSLQGTGNQPTWDGFYYYLLDNKNAWEGQGVDVNTIMNLQGADRTQFGGQGIIQSGGKAPTAAELKQKATISTAFDSIRGFGDIMSNYWNGSNHLGPVRVVNPTSQSAGQIESGKKVYLSALIKQFGAARGKYIYDDFVKSFPGDITPSGNAAGKLQGHLESLLTKNQMVIAKNKGKNTISIKLRSQLEPGDEVVKATTETIPQLSTLISEL